MILSPIYDGKVFWVWVYHTQPGSTEVEILHHKLHSTKEKGLKWFKKNRKAENYIEPELVPVMVNKLKLLSNIESGKPCG